MDFAKQRYGKHFGSQSSFNQKNNKNFIKNYLIILKFYPGETELQKQNSRAD